MKYPKKVQKFLNMVIKDCANSGVKVTLVNKPRIYLGGDIYVTGYFNHEDKEIQVATKQSLSHWLGILAHEYSHFCQWQENCKIWREVHDQQMLDACSLVDMWLEKSIELSPKKKQMYLNQVIAFELDCEKRAVRLIKKHKLPIDLPEYIKKANAYLASYQAIGALRKWPKPGKSPYLIDEIWTRMPDKFNYNYYRALSPAQSKIRFKRCFQR